MAEMVGKQRFLVRQRDLDLVDFPVRVYASGNLSRCTYMQVMRKCRSPDVLGMSRSLPSEYGARYHGVGAFIMVFSDSIMKIINVHILPRFS
jgi:hypothetical protein